MFPLTYCVSPCDCRDIDMAEFLSSDPDIQDAHPHTVYDLMANICHDGQPGQSCDTHVVSCDPYGMSQVLEKEPTELTFDIRYKQW